MILLDVRTILLGTTSIFLDAILLDAASIILGVTSTIHYATSFLLDVTSVSSIPEQFFSIILPFSLDTRTLLNAILLDVTSILLGVTLTIHYATSFLLDVTSVSSIPEKKFSSMPVRFHWMPLRSSQLPYLSNAPLLKPMTK